MNKSAMVEALMIDCLNGKQEGAVMIQGVVRTYALSAARVAEHKEEIRTLLNEMPDTFHKEKGGGWSFLLCTDKHDDQWTGEHRIMESLVVLGLAAGMASFCLPREVWSALPGGVPYVVFDTAP